MISRFMKLRDTLIRRTKAAGKYTHLAFNEAAIVRGDYKEHLGGGSDSWHRRGLFQLELLRSRGLQPSSTLLDIGCGPLRAGTHFIEYLNPGNYLGFDYNSSFVEAAEYVIVQRNLAHKNPTLLVVADFDVRTVRQFDYAIAFSVLNHCNENHRKLFFRNVGQNLGPGGKLLITHARWLSQKHLDVGGLEITRAFEAHDLDTGSFGWSAAEAASVFPIYEFKNVANAQ
jgi:SAM-dependent methyltransferase